MLQIQSRAQGIFILLGGLGLVICALVDTPQLQRLFLICLGVIGLIAGAWSLYAPRLPKARQFRVLRNEVDTFLDMVRQLHALIRSAEENTPYPWHHQTCDNLKTAMHDSVERMAEVAAVSDRAPASTPNPDPESSSQSNVQTAS